MSQHSVLQVCVHWTQVHPHRTGRDIRDLKVLAEGLHKRKFIESLLTPEFTLDKH